MNGFRVGYLRKLFPDAKFIHIRRNPVKTCKSQILMQKAYLKTFYMDEWKWRKANMYPKYPKDHETYKENWAYLTHGHYPADYFGQMWFVISLTKQSRVIYIYIFTKYNLIFHT